MEEVREIKEIKMLVGPGEGDELESELCFLRLSIWEGKNLGEVSETKFAEKTS